MKIPILYKAVLVALLLAACSKSGPPVLINTGVPEAPRAIDTLALRVFSISQDTVISSLVTSWPTPQVDVVQDDTEAIPGAQQASESYRVQLFTTKELAKAIAVRNEAEGDFGRPVKVDFETPYYKVRVGHFQTPAEAEMLLKEARRLGYRGAWAVRVRTIDAVD